MTVNTTNITSGPYIGNGTADTFSYTFRIVNKNQVKVFETDNTGNTTELTVDVDYTVAGIGNDTGGTITRTSGVLPTGYVWYIRANYPGTQLTTFQSQSAFFPELHENAIDQLTFLIQQLYDSIDRVAKLPESYSGPLPLSLPEPKSGSLLFWNKDEDGFVNGGVPGVVVPSEVEQTVPGMQANLSLVDGDFVTVSDTNQDYRISTIDDGDAVTLVNGLFANPANKGANFSEFGTAENKAFDIYIKQERVNLLRGVPNDEIPAILAGTSTYDLSSIVQSAVNYCSANHAKLELPHGRLNFTNILLPQNGIEVIGVHTHATEIINSSTLTPAFRTAGGVRNLWTMLDKFKIITPDGGTSAINIKSFEHLLIGELEITTAPAERGSGTSCGILIERDINTDFGYYLDICQSVKVDKHGYGLRLKGVSGANCNAHAIRGLVTNDNTNAGVRLDWCTGVKVADGSAELNRNNIEIFDSEGCIVRGYYMERPETHNIQITRGNVCQVIGNPILSSAGAGADGSGSTPDANGRSVYIAESVGTIVRDNGFNAPWSFYDVEVTSNCSACEVTDNRKKERVNQFNQYKVEVLDSAGDTIIRNFQKTAGGNVIYLDESSARQVVSALETTVGNELNISQTGSKIFSGNGSPEGTVTADRGSIYLRTDGGGGFTFYVKETGDATNTGWVAK